MDKLTAIAGGSTLVYAVLAFLMGVLPGIELSRVAATPGARPLTPTQARGRAIYVSEGCAYCHTQQVRPLAADAIFGRPSAAGDFAYQTPELLGSERTGPDLSNVGARQASDVWQYIHLYDPRAVVPQSIMPSFRWLFRTVAEAPAGVQPVPLPAPYAPATGVVVPGEDAQALVAYLLSLRQPALATTQAGAGTASPAATNPAATSPATAASATSAPPAGTPATSGAAPGPLAAATGAGTPAAFDAGQGARLFAANCAACHGAQGAGVPGVFPPLVRNPVVVAADPAEHMSVVLHGLHGKAIDGKTYAAQMPPFAATLSDAQIADIIDHERTSWGNHAPLVTAKDVAAIRAKR